MMKTQKSEERGHRWWRTAAIAAVLLVAAGCSDGNGGGNGLAQAEYTLTPAQSCDDVRDHIAEASTEDVINWMYSDYGWAVDDGMAGDMNSDNDAGAPEGDGDSSDAPSEYTDTNVQEEGVDEPDIVKTDGQYIYTLADGALQIIKSWPADETEVVGRFDLPTDSTASSIFLEDDMIVVFSRVWQNSYYGDSNSGMNDGNFTEPSDDETTESNPFTGTRVSFFDISDRSDPEPIRHLEIEGSYVDGRMVGDKVYMVTNSNLHVGDTWGIQDEIDDLPERTYDETEEELEQMRDDARPLIYAHIRASLDEAEPSEWLPRQRELAGDYEQESIDVVHKCTDLYIPGVAAELGVLNISSFDVDADAELESTGLISNGWEVYASQANLYVAMSSRSWWWGWWGGDRKNESHIHKFALGGDGKPEYKASGRVDGWILNQFSFSEWDGHLRVATTDNQWEFNPDINESEDTGGNHLIVLKEEDGELVETGSVRDLAPTERIYSARFTGDKGYLVTFFETDPLFTFDLSDHTNPQVLGELKIEGYSSYMHPLDDDHLLAIGLDGDENGVMGGVHIQIFDVSDMTDPQQKYVKVISTGGWSSSSEAMNNHHAFTYQPRLGVLAVPMNIWEDDEQFSGLILYDIDTDAGISEIGRIDHSDLVPANDYYWYSQIRRSIMMSGDDDQEYIYSLSNHGLKVNETFEVENELASILLQQ